MSKALNSRGTDVRAIAGVVLALALLLATAPAARAQEVIVLRYGEYARNVINTRIHRWTYVFDAARGDLVSISVEALDGDLDPYVILRDFDGNELATDDDGGGGLDALLQYPVYEGGRYIIEVTRFGGEDFPGTGNYELRLDGVSNGALGTSPPYPPLANGVALSNAINETQQAVWYSYPAWRGDLFDLTVTRQDGDFTPRVTVYVPGGEHPLLDMVSGESGQVFMHGLMLPMSGYYAIRVSTAPGSAAGARGTYDILVRTQTGEPPEQLDTAALVALPLGGTASGALDVAQNERYYTFEGEAGQFVRAAMAVTSGDLAPLLVLLGEKSETVAFDDTPSVAMIGQAQLPYTGRYVLVARRLAGSGEYTIATQVLDSDSVAMPAGAVSATLRWEGGADLDLIVRDPAGAQGERFTSANDGCANYAAEPVEHVYWPTDAPQGAYEVVVWHRDACTSPERAAPVAFELTVTVGSVQVASVRGTLEPGEQYRTLVTR
jgi:hypothetical protein